jgi:hypothetical protein
MRLPIRIARFAPATNFAHKVIAAGVNMADPSFDFSHAEKGLTRFPPNVEQISVEHESMRTWLVMRRNDVMLRFPLTEEDCRHLAVLLTQDHR